jgi:peptidyl-prolyl cis-trans isomerase SurA
VFKIKNLLAILVLPAAGALAAQEPPGELSETGQFIDGVAAIVNEGVVLKSSYLETLELIRAQAEQSGFELPPEPILKEQVLERVILNEIQLQQAERIGLEISDQMLNQILNDVASNMGGTLANLPDMLARQGVDYQDFRRQMREDVTIEQLRRIRVDQQIQVSPREIEQCIADLENNVVVNSEYNLSHILLSLPEGASSDEIDEIVATADEIYERATAGEDFRQLAARYSESPTSLEGGSLGWMKGEQVPTVFTDILAPLGDGDVSRPFRTASSIHIVKVNDMRSAVEQSQVDQVHARHILITPNEIIDDETAQQQLEDAYERIEGGEDFGEVAKLLSDDPGSANLGGDLGWAGPGTFVPEFDKAVSELEIGELSEPFRSQFGWHIVEVVDRRVYDNTEDLKEQNCVVRIRASKRDAETQLWLRRIRDEAFVDVRM